MVDEQGKLCYSSYSSSSGGGITSIIMAISIPAVIDCYYSLLLPPLRNQSGE
jgi:hypothetical protein